MATEFYYCPFCGDKESESPGDPCSKAVCEMQRREYVQPAVPGTGYNPLEELHSEEIPPKTQPPRWMFEDRPEFEPDEDIQKQRQEECPLCNGKHPWVKCPRLGSTH